MILLWGLPGDRPLEQVQYALYRLGQEVAFLDQRDVLDTQLEISLMPNARGTIWAIGETFDLSAVTAVYARPYDTRELPEVKAAGEGSSAWQHALLFDELLWSWIELSGVRVVNPPEACASNNSKPHHIQQIRLFGFTTPETLVTTDPAVARAFWKEHGEVIYKSVSGVRSIVSRLRPEDEARLEDVAWCPTQFQAYVPGVDYRVHVVGQEVFTCEMESDADDYRYARQVGKVVGVRSCDLPPEVRKRCIQLTAGLGLLVAGIDLRRTPDGDWVCFEVNPSPGFSYYQDETGLPIDAAIARLLAYAGAG